MLAVIAALLLADVAAAGAKASIVQGALEVKGAADPDYKAVKAGAEIEIGSWIRTPAGAKALLELPDAVELRIHEQTELLFEAPRKLNLKSGRIYIKVARASAPFELITEHHPIRIEEVVLDLEYTPRVPNGAPATTTIMVLEGNVKAFSKKYAPIVNAGWVATAFGTQLNTPLTINNSAMDTSWVHSLLVERGKTDEETSLRTEELLSILSKAPAPDPAEAALRSLGELAAPGIARFLGRSVLETQVARRAAAAKALGDAATMKSIALLPPLLAHAEAAVRVSAAGALARIAGKDLGYNEGYWKGDKLEAGQKAWDAWVRQNSK